MKLFIRTCQSCFHEQEARDPATYKGDTWRDVKCKHCKQDNLDYGSLRCSLDPCPTPDDCDENGCADTNPVFVHIGGTEC